MWNLGPWSAASLLLWQPWSQSCVQRKRGLEHYHLRHCCHGLLVFIPYQTAVEDVVKTLWWRQALLILACWLTSPDKFAALRSVMGGGGREKIQTALSPGQCGRREPASNTWKHMKILTAPFFWCLGNAYKHLVRSKSCCIHWGNISGWICLKRGSFLLAESWDCCKILSSPWEKGARSIYFPAKEAPKASLLHFVRPGKEAFGEMCLFGVRDLSSFL